jgi:phenylalanyl-tRNA synthetase alpha chain
MLRTHTTAGIPPLLAETRSDRLIVCPGLAYRRDVVDRLHVGEPHQVDLWIARQDRLRRAHLLEMIAAVVETVFAWPSLSLQRDHSSLHDEWAGS